MGYEDWENEVPAAVKCEPIWKFAGCRKALFLNDVCDEVIALVADELGRQRRHQHARRPRT